MLPTAKLFQFRVALLAPVLLLACSSSGGSGDAAGGSGGEVQGGNGGDSQGNAGSAGHASGGTGGNASEGGGNGVGGSGGGNGNAAGSGGKASGGSGGMAGSMAAGGSAGAMAGAGGAPTAGAGGSLPPIGTLYASEDFASPANTDAKDLTTTNGMGWDTPWQIGEHSGPNYATIAAAKPMTYLALKTSGNYLSHQQWDIGRRLDITKSLKPFVNGNVVGKSGSTFWLSALVRIDSAASKDPAFITLHSDTGLGFHFYGATQWGAGIYPGKGVNKWSLFLGEMPNEYMTLAAVNGVTHSSNKALEVGATTLLVVKVELLGGADKVSLWVNPPTLRASDPGAPDVSITTTKAAAFRGFAFSGGGGDSTKNETSLDEVRLGDSFAAVTP